MKEKDILLHASEHCFLLSFSEILMLRNFARAKKFNYCSEIGGSESIRDIQEAKNIDADAFEFKIVESLFSISKISTAVPPLQCLLNINIYFSSFVITDPG